ncbi:unnamed protein product [Rotaria socialis]|uniref:Uncharacterized protein n=1 Tax=Rotaria socialis TaxID=392032 RepID=A0A821V666_9BILA|nr:unnamed protein product [Rotaria socialis]CAF4901812.1 unnamed protein product [Rotaria socialis]
MASLGTILTMPTEMIYYLNFCYPFIHRVLPLTACFADILRFNNDKNARNAVTDIVNELKSALERHIDGNVLPLSRLLYLVNALREKCKPPSHLTQHLVALLEELNLLFTQNNWDKLVTVHSTAYNN